MEHDKRQAITPVPRKAGSLLRDGTVITAIVFGHPASEKFVSASNGWLVRLEYPGWVGYRRERFQGKRDPPFYCRMAGPSYVGANRTERVLYNVGGYGEFAKVSGPLALPYPWQGIS